MTDAARLAAEEFAQQRVGRREVTGSAGLGVDLIEVMVSGGHITPDSCNPWEERFTPDELATTRSSKTDWTSER